MQPSSVPPSTAPHAPLHRHTLLFWTLGALACVVAWDAAGQDLAFAQVFGSSNGFPMRDQWFFVQVLHEGARRLGWLLVLLLALSVWWPRGFLRKLDASERLQMAVSALLSLAVVSITKNLSATSCPWDLAQFGGVARHVSHWALGVLDGGSGRCFPAGHASAGFAFLGGYFALRHKAPTAARWWLAGALLAGFVLGAAQQVRGAQVAVLGQVARPGRYPLESTAMKVTDVLALAGGTAPQGADRVILTGVRNGRRVRAEIDVADLFVAWTPEKDVAVMAGDTLYVHRAPQFYVYGEVQRAGAYRVERQMTVLQALSLGGGLSPRGTERGIRIHRRGEDGAVRVTNPQLNDPVQPDDVIVVREALF